MEFNWIQISYNQTTRSNSRTLTEEFIAIGGTSELVQQLIDLSSDGIILRGRNCGYPDTKITGVRVRPVKHGEFARGTIADLTHNN